MTGKQLKMYEALKNFEKSEKTCDDYVDLFVMVRHVLAPTDGISCLMMIEAIEKVIKERKEE